MKRPATIFVTLRLAAGWCALALLCLWLPAATTARAAAPPDPAPAASPSAEEQRMIGILTSLHQQTGKITLKDGIADLNVPEQFRYLDAADSRKVLVDLWGNPPKAAEGILGMLIPAHFYEDDAHTWGATITFLDAGYIKEEDPKYDEILQQMKEAQEQANPEREKEGYKPLHLIGWAQPPRYDKESKKLYWAKELQVGDLKEHTLNYDIRILGRRGALELGVIAGMDQLGQINNFVPQILSTVEFNQGHRYVDFDPKTDKVAPYALAGLIGGGLLLAKVGGFKALLAILLAAKKFVIIGVVAVGAFFKRLFGGGTKVNTDRPGPPTGTV